MIKRILVALLTVGLMIMATGCSTDGASDPAYRTLRYEGGDTGGSEFKECLDEGEKLATNDRFYSYPNTQRQDKWDSNNYKQGAKSADYPDMVMTAQGGVNLSLKVTVPFRLNTSCEDVEANGKTYPGGTIQAFHEIFGKTRDGYFDPTEDGNDSYSDGWLWLMDTYISNCVIQTLTPEVRPLDPEDAWLKDTVRQNLNNGLQEKIQACVDNSMETELQFYVIGNPTVDLITPDNNFTSLYRERNDADTRAETAEVNKKAKVREAQADAAVAAARAKAKRAEISAYKNEQNYLREKAIESGMNPWLDYQGGEATVPAQ